MSLKTIVKGTLIGLISTLLLSTSIFAKDFSDVPDDFWAKDTIKEMSDSNIIVGYTDGTFKPNKEVKKVEALILLARVIGVDSEENKSILEQAEQNYKDILSEYDTYAKREIAFLLQKKILKQDELDAYIGNGNDETSMLRREVVPIMVRLMGKEDELLNKGLVILGYKDAELIPQELRVYVEYLTSEGLMGTATDDNRFLPDGSITRAQIATLASRIIKKLGSTDIPNPEDTNTEDTNDTTENIIGGAIQNVGVDSVEGKKVISLLTISNGKIDNIKIPISGSIEIIIDGKKSFFGLIKVGDYAWVTMNENGEAVKISTEKKDKIITGIVNSVNLDDNTVEVKVNSDIVSVNINSSSEITRNDAVSSINYIKKGDNVTAYLEYNIVKKMILRSVYRIAQGDINEIVISKNPKLTIINLQGNPETYELNNNIDINIIDKKSDIYGLRLGYKAKVSLDSSEVVSVSAYEQVVGTIEMIEESFGEIILIPNDTNLGESLQLLISQNTKYFNNTSNTQIKLSDIKSGQKVVALGRFGKSTFYVKEIAVVE